VLRKEWNVKNKQRDRFLHSPHKKLSENSKFAINWSFKLQRDNVKLEKDYIPPKKEKKKEKDLKKAKKSKTSSSQDTNIRIGLTLPPDVC
jgi:hypothetical protein